MSATPPQDRLLDCTEENQRESSLARAAEVVREGKVVVLPTDTVYGVGADAFDVVAVAMVLAAKHRGREMPPPVLVPNPRTVDGLATDLPMYARMLMRHFWPGPLTLVLRAQPSLQWDLGETNGTVALRMPDDEIALSLLAEVGPLAVSSANVTGQPAATTAQEALDQLGGAVAAYLDGGPRTGGEPSTILDCTGEEPVVLRLGALGAEDIRAVLGRTVLHDSPSDAEPAAEGGEHDGIPEGDAAGDDDAQDDRAALVGSVRPSGVPAASGSMRTIPATSSAGEPSTP
ncbi:TsaC protein (YrdC domain) required for threonylcarbamoyladenosine t(6)A37 modification in tRNA [Serinicoccus hydrothermalis]|uniref:L-threonylcarbamoyladenylate synthase n=1 Tax=Serinicoccus hydrothermalis TaxID=1758689 RepID=A0A1B1NB97_9MICO|nr:L-threonylcarbamoyladenylate synthase [Serinicoccus hydrothermalis]ANS78655.1 TsaC protein (YrdC domain) required for threonylcarbamoyladenosine t(6)A37 modification in tRNA [Serinicoccus hydrothermalis]